MLTCCGHSGPSETFNTSENEWTFGLARGHVRLRRTANTLGANEITPAFKRLMFLFRLWCQKQPTTARPSDDISYDVISFKIFHRLLIKAGQWSARLTDRILTNQWLVSGHVIMTSIGASLTFGSPVRSTPSAGGAFPLSADWLDFGEWSRLLVSRQQRSWKVSLQQTSSENWIKIHRNRQKKLIKTEVDKVITEILEFWRKVPRNLLIKNRTLFSTWLRSHFTVSSYNLDVFHCRSRSFSTFCVCLLAKQ